MELRCPKCQKPVGDAKDPELFKKLEDAGKLKFVKEGYEVWFECECGYRLLIGWYCGEKRAYMPGALKNLAGEVDKL